MNEQSIKQEIQIWLPMTCVHYASNPLIRFVPVDSYIHRNSAGGSGPKVVKNQLIRLSNLCS